MKLVRCNRFNEVTLMEINVKSMEVQNKKIKTQLHRYRTGCMGLSLDI